MYRLVEKQLRLTIAMESLLNIGWALISNVQDNSITIARGGIFPLPPGGVLPPLGFAPPLPPGGVLPPPRICLPPGGVLPPLGFASPQEVFCPP